MPDTALVIGIDGYGPKEWELGGAVRDALAFARWVTATGGVLPANLKLLLSPPAGAPPADLPAGATLHGPATSQAIVDAVADLQNATAGGGRLWVYYAGHGVAVRWAAEPLLIPVDFSDPQRHGRLLIGFSQVIPALTTAPFAEQIFLIDACRDFALKNHRPPAITSPVGAFVPTEDAEIAEERPRQYVLYSVAPGQRANDLGKGVWTDTLLEGLGRRSYQVVELEQGRDGAPRYEIRLGELARWVRRRVEDRIARIQDIKKYVQKPEYVPDPRGDDPLLAAFADHEVPPVQIEVFVEPPYAWQTCKVAVMQYVGGLRKEIEIVASGPPVEPPASFTLPPSNYSFRAEAERFTLRSKPWTVEDEPTVELTLEEAIPPGVPGAPVSTTRGGLEGMLGGGPEEVWRPGSYSLNIPAFSPGGMLTVSAPDRYAHIEVLDQRKKVERVGLGRLEDLFLEPGIYRVRLRLPGAPPIERTVEVRDGSEQKVRIELPPSRLKPRELDLLQFALGTVGGARLASLLAFAAYAAQQPDRNSPLRRIGAQRFHPGPGASSGLLVLVGSAAAEGPDQVSFLDGSFLRLREADGKVVHQGLFESLAGDVAAAQSLVPLPGAGSHQAELRLPGFAPTCYSVAVLPNRLAILVAVAERDGSVEVQQHSIPVPGWLPAFREYVEDVDGLRHWELAQSFYAAGEGDAAMAVVSEQSSGPEEVADGGGAPEGRSPGALLRGDRLDPLLGCLTGYVLVRRGQAQDFLGFLWRGEPDILEDPEGPVAEAARERGPISSALRNLVAFFPELPDVHILAGQCDPVEERRSSHFERALRRGLPIFAEGARTLLAWSRREGVILPAELARPLRRMLRGSPWTAWEPGEKEEPDPKPERNA